jgi:hypothetical protein
MNPLSLLGSTGSIIAVLGLLGTLAGGAIVIIHEHDAKIVAQVAAQQAVVVAQAQHDQDQRTIAGLNKEATTAATRAAGLAQIKEAINAAPRTTTCANSPAIVALIGALRSSAGGGNADPAHALAGVSVGVPGIPSTTR